MKKRTLFCLCFLILFFFSCSSPPPPKPIVQNIHSAEMMVSEAKETGAETYAPLELRQAEDKIQEARKALNRNEVQKATQLAEEAMMDAKIAEAKAEAAKAKKRQMAEEKDVEILKDEVDRIQTTE